jgi:hypothetical protein
MLRAKGFASGNGFDVSGVGGGIGRSVPAATGAIGGTLGTVMVVEDCWAGGGNGGVVVGNRSGGTDDGIPVRKEAGCGGRGRQDSGEGGGRTKDVGNSDAGTVEAMTSVSKDASTRLPVRRLGREPERFFADAGEALEALAAFSGDLCPTSFPLDLERVFRGERRDGPACAVAPGGTRFSGGRVEGSISRFFELYCSSCSCSCFDYEM